MDDWDLLERFRLAASEQAFAELVRRHAGFVLATCRRRLRDAHLGEDAAQAVFLVLARRPPVRSASNATLTGWLYKTAIYACNNAMQASRTRQQHERQAARQAAISSDPRGLSKTPTDVEVLLDQALAELSSKERDAVLLRYYQDRSVQEVGAALGISQNTATKRIGRAIEHMRQFVASKGLAITAPALIDSLSRTMGEPIASTEFITETISIGTGQSAASAAVQQLAEGVDFVIRIAQIKLVASVVIAVILACGGIFGVNQLMAQDAKRTAARPSQPTTKPTEVAEEEPIDISTPKGALRAFAKATRAADFETLQRVSKPDANYGIESELLGAANNYQKSMGELFAAVRAKFGDNELRKFSRQRGAIPLEPFLRLIEVELDQHDVVVEGETAKIVDRQAPKTDTNIKLVREDGVWKVASTGLATQFGEEQATRRMEMLRTRAEILKSVADDVTAGQFENIEAVGNGLREALRR